MIHSLIRYAIYFLFLGITAIAQPYSSVHISSNTESISPGSHFLMDIQLDHEDAWHSYWKNPADSGLPAQFEWTLPPGFSIETVTWPLPEVIAYGSLINYGFSDQVHFIVTIAVGPDVAHGEYQLEGELNILVCKESCIPETHAFSLSVTVQEHTTQSSDHRLIETRLINQTLPIIDGHFDYQDQDLMLSFSDIEIGSIDSIYFFSESLNRVTYLPSQSYTKTDNTVTVGIDSSSLSQMPLQGVLLINNQDYYALNAEYISAGLNSQSLSIKTVLSAILFAFLGGLLLNVMPCVFPILSLKVLSILEKSAVDLRSIRRQSLYYLAGVQGTFMFLVVLLLGLRVLGLELGWGFQLQQPVVVFVMIVIMSWVGLYLNEGVSLPLWLDSFTGSVQRSSAKLNQTGPGYDFFTGVLAVLVATPCTAPFMAPAIGFSLLQPPLIMVSVFLSLGLGFAFPFLLIAYIPRFHQWLPKPGKWMVTIKHGLAIPVYLTVVWLIWVMEKQVGTVAVGVASVMILAMLIRSFVERKQWCSSFLLSSVQWIIFFLCLLFIMYSHDSGVTAKGDTVDTINELLVNDQAVFVDVTASWCLTCKLNESAVLHNKDVQAFFQSQDIAFVQLDWTQYDPEITQYLAQFDRQGVPLYVYYNNKGNPVVLPQLLTKDLIISLKGVYDE